MATFSERIHGRKPKVAPFIETDPIEMLNKLLRGEITNWDQIAELSNLYQDYMLGAYEEAIPGFRDILAEGGAGTEELLAGARPLIRGEIPEDVRSQVMRSSAYESLMGGTAGAPMAAAHSARNLGLTGLDVMNKGANLLLAGGNAAQRWAGLAQGTILPPTQSMYSPEWFTNFMAQQAAGKQATKQFKFNVEAAPDPEWAHRAQLLASYGGMALGGAMGGKGKDAGEALQYQSYGAPQYQVPTTTYSAPPAAQPVTYDSGYLPESSFKTVIPPTYNYNPYATGTPYPGGYPGGF